MRQVYDPINYLCSFLWKIASLSRELFLQKSSIIYIWWSPECAYGCSIDLGYWHELFIGGIWYVLSFHFHFIFYFVWLFITNKLNKKWLKLITTISIFVAQIPGLSCLWYPLASFLIFHATLQYQKLWLFSYNSKKWLKSSEMEPNVVVTSILTGNIKYR